MSTTPNLDLPEMPANTFQPSVVYNESMQRLDAIVVLIAEDLGLTTPPITVSGDVGKRWIVKTGATGAWAGQTNNIALCTAAGLWLFIEPGVNWRAWVSANNAVTLNKYYRFTGSAWVDDSAAGGVTEAPTDSKSYVRKNAAWLALDADGVPFVSSTGITATNVGDALDEVKGLIPSSTPPTQSIVAACSDETTALTAGNGKVTFRNPYANVFTITAVKASLTTAQTSGSILTIDINEAGTSILSTKLTIDNTEKTSATAAVAPVISDTSIAADAEITVDIDQVGDGTAKGLKVYLIGHL